MTREELRTKGYVDDEIDELMEMYMMLMAYENTDDGIKEN